MKKHSICEQERLIGKAGEVQREDCISALRIRQKVVHQTQHSIQDILSEALELGELLPFRSTIAGKGKASCCFTPFLLAH